jgi:uncharacterized protein (DUF2252 family)
MPDAGKKRAAPQADSWSVVDEILRVNRDRKPRGLAIKYERMAADPFAFFRGTLHLFAREWSEFHPADTGPDLLSCGDLHLENFGAYETDDGVFCFDVNDFDEALVAPAAFDLVRVTTSILLGAELWELPAAGVNETAQLFAAQYRQAVQQASADLAGCELTLQHGSGPIWELLGKASLSTAADMLDRHTKIGRSGERRIVRSDNKHPDLNADRVDKLTQAVQAYGAAHGRGAAFRVLDVSGRIAGIGSLGVRRALVLIEGDGSPDGNKLLDIKEALPSEVASWVGHALKAANEAQRVVDAQRQVQARPTAGLDALPIDGRWYRMRSMVPDENRSKLEVLKPDVERLRSAIAAAGQIVGWAHVRGAKWAKTNTELARFAAAGESIDVLVSAARAAQRARDDYEIYLQAFRAGKFKVHDS